MKVLFMFHDRYNTINSTVKQMDVPFEDLSDECINHCLVEYFGADEFEENEARSSLNRGEFDQDKTMWCDGGEEQEVIIIKL